MALCKVEVRGNRLSDECMTLVVGSDKCPFRVTQTTRAATISGKLCFTHSLGGGVIGDVCAFSRCKSRISE